MTRLMRAAMSILASIEGACAQLYWQLEWRVQEREQKAALRKGER